MSSQPISQVSNMAVIRSLVYAPLGAPVLPQELEIDPDMDIYPSLIEYYKYIPIKHIVNHYFMTDREWFMQISSNRPDSSIELCPEKSPYFYIGPVDYAVRHQLGQARFDEYLLGMNYTVPNYDPERTVLNATLVDINIGDVYYEEEFHLDRIKWIVGGACLLSIVMGWGHRNIEAIPPRNLELMSLIVGNTYYQRVLALRGTGNFEKSDFTISNEILESALKEVKEKKEKMIQSLSLIPVVSG